VLADVESRLRACEGRNARGLCVFVEDLLVYPPRPVSSLSRRGAWLHQPRPGHMPISLSAPMTSGQELAEPTVITTTAVTGPAPDTTTPGHMPRVLSVLIVSRKGLIWTHCHHHHSRQQPTPHPQSPHLRTLNPRHVQDIQSYADQATVKTPTDQGIACCRHLTLRHSTGCHVCNHDDHVAINHEGEGTRR
jgi:hypothetical protein